MDITHTISLIELAVFLLALLGLLVTLMLMPGVLYSILLVRRKRINGIMRRTTHSDLREEGQRAWRLLGYTVFSVLAMTVPPALRETNRETADWFLLFIITCVVGDTTNSVVGALDRAKNMTDAARERLADTARYKRDKANVDNPDWQQPGDAESHSAGFYDRDQYDPTRTPPNGLPGASQGHTGQPGGTP